MNETPNTVTFDQLLTMNDNIVAIARIVDGLIDRMKKIEASNYDCPPGVRAAVHLTAALPDYLSGSIVSQFELLHQSIVDRIKHEIGNKHVPAPADDE